MPYITIGFPTIIGPFLTILSHFGPSRGIWVVAQTWERQYHWEVPTLSPARKFLSPGKWYRIDLRDRELRQFQRIYFFRSLNFIHSRKSSGKISKALRFFEIFENHSDTIGIPIVIQLKS